MAITSINTAIQAYNNAAKSFGSGAATTSDAAASGSDFASMLKDGFQSAIQAGEKSETMSKQAIAGKADVREVVAAVNNAELTLQTVVAVRDKVIGAYNDILKMSI